MNRHDLKTMFVLFAVSLKRHHFDSVMRVITGVFVTIGVTTLFLSVMMVSIVALAGFLRMLG